VIRSGEVSHGSELLVKWCEMLHGLIEGDSESEEEEEEDDDDDDEDRITYIGVHKPRGRKKYTATIKLQGKQVYLGTFDTSIQAARAYDEKARLIEGKQLNFPSNGNKKGDDEEEEEEEEEDEEDDDDDDDVTLKASELCSYRGVRKRKNKWSMRITVNGNMICRTFDTAMEAAKEYDRLVCKMIA
jgi:hypothetical protein